MLSSWATRLEHKTIQNVINRVAPNENSFLVLAHLASEMSKKHTPLTCSRKHLPPFPALCMYIYAPIPICTLIIHNNQKWHPLFFWLSMPFLWSYFSSWSRASRARGQLLIITPYRRRLRVFSGCYWRGLTRGLAIAAVGINYKLLN